MKLADMTVAQFVDTVASDAPAPGGGSVAALAGSIGAALTAMVGNLTQGRKKYAQYAEFAARVEAKGNELKARLLDVMDRDTEAFMLVSDAFSMPKATDEEKAARSAAIQAGLKACTKTPMEMMELCAETAELASDFAENGFNETFSSTSPPSRIRPSPTSIGQRARPCWMTLCPSATRGMRRSWGWSDDPHPPDP